MTYFTLTKKDPHTSARTGTYSTHHGDFATPNFMPVGTQGTVKGIDIGRLEEALPQIVLVNTYHLWQRPTPEVVEKLGGIHTMMGWSGPILSDSGGFQIFSLKGLRKLSEEGVTFKSHLDGSSCFLSPEKAIQIQETLGVDIAMVLDECPPPEMDKKGVELSWERTLRWAKRCLEARENTHTRIFGITQGGMHKDLRTRSAEELSTLSCDGFAIGGLSVGEAKEIMYEVLSYHPEQLPQQSIRYLMGVGTPQDILEGVKNGVDLFDCVMPTRSGRFGRAFVSGPGAPYCNIRNAQFKEDNDPLDSQCNCLACKRYSKGYLHHLFRADEMLGPQMLSLHNITYYLNLMREIREAIAEDTFAELYQREARRW